MNRKIWMGMLALVSLLTFAEAEISTLNEAINKAGRQRMLSQRMMKDYSMIGMKIRFGDPQQELQKSAALFSDTLKDLLAFTKDKDKASYQALQEVETLWKPLKKELLQERAACPSAEGQSRRDFQKDQPAPRSCTQSHKRYRCNIQRVYRGDHQCLRTPEDALPETGKPLYAEGLGCGYG